MSRTLRASLPAALVSVVVLVLALAGTATAAKLITGKNIKNNTVSTQDIKNGSVKSTDVKNGGLTGADLAAGSVGPAQLSASAKNEVRVDDGADFNLPTCTDTGLGACSPVVVTGMTPGTWLVTATVTVDNFAGPATSITNLCGLVRGNANLAEARTPLAANGAPGEAESITLQQVVVATDATPVSLRCTEMVGESLRVGSPTLTALKVS